MTFKRKLFVTFSAIIILPLFLAVIAYCAFAHVEELAPGGGAQWK